METLISLPLKKSKLFLILFLLDSPYPASPTIPVQLPYQLYRNTRPLIISYIGLPPHQVTHLTSYSLFEKRVGAMGGLGCHTFRFGYNDVLLSKLASAIPSSFSSFLNLHHSVCYSAFSLSACQYLTYILRMLCR